MAWQGGGGGGGGGAWNRGIHNKQESAYLMAKNKYNNYRNGRHGHN